MSVRVEIRPVTEQECRLLWEWANDPAVRASAFCSGPIPWDTHVAWFRRKQADPNCVMSVVTDHEGHPVGQVRFDRQPDGWVEVDVSIEAASRGRGYGTEALRLACEQLFVTRTVRAVKALVKSTNVSSIRAFERAGFSPIDRQTVHGVEVVCLRLARQVGG